MVKGPPRALTLDQTQGEDSTRSDLRGILGRAVGRETESRRGLNSPKETWALSPSHLRRLALSWEELPADPSVTLSPQCTCGLLWS